MACYARDSIMVSPMERKSEVEHPLENLKEADAQGIIGLISTAAISGIIPHNTLTKLLPRPGVVWQADISEVYRENLDLSSYPPEMRGVLGPIWASMQKELCVD